MNPPPSVPPSLPAAAAPPPPRSPEFASRHLRVGVWPAWVYVVYGSFYFVCWWELYKGTCPLFDFIFPPLGRPPVRPRIKGNCSVRPRNLTRQLLPANSGAAILPRSKIETAICFVMILCMFAIMKTTMKIKNI